MRNFVYLLLPTLFIFTSCNSDIPLSLGIDEFGVSTEKNVYKIGEEVTFHLEGNADMITFYSGEIFHDYDFREGRIIQLDNASLSFTTSKPTVWKAQEDQLKLMLSTDFNGDCSDFSNIEAATWTDITHLFKLSTTISFIHSGVVDLSEYHVKDKPIYIAFRYILNTMDYGRPGVWHFQNFSFSANSVLGPIVLGDMETAGFQIVDMHPDKAPSRSKQTKTRVTLQGYEQTEDNNIYTETWAVSTGFYLNDIDRGPDKPLSIKNLESSSLTSFNYTYHEPGTYKAVFVATNANIDNFTRTAKEVVVTVEPDESIEP